MATKFFSSVDELRINEIGVYIVNGWTINVTEKVSGGWRGTMKHENGKEKAFDNSITHIKKKASASGNKETKKAVKTELLGTTKKIVTKGTKLENFDTMFEKACNMEKEYKNALGIVQKYNEIFNKYDFPNNTLKLVQHLQVEQNESIKKIRTNQRAKALFSSRYELAEKHLKDLKDKLVQSAMLDKFDEIPNIKKAINEQTEHIENLKKQIEKF